MDTAQTDLMKDFAVIAIEIYTYRSILLQP
jgi:hypothetical protein